MTDVTAKPLVRGVKIEGYKSILRASFELGRVNVLIGENGSGKSNVLEALAVAAGFAANKLDNEFLASRGVRTTESSRMTSLFEENVERPCVVVDAGGAPWTTPLALLSTDIPGGDIFALPSLSTDLPARLEDELRRLPEVRELGLADDALLQEFVANLLDKVIHSNPVRTAIKAFLNFTPEYSALHTFRDETQILPIGIHGEGLFAHLKDLSRSKPDVVDAIAEELRVIDWFGGFDVPDDLSPGEKRLRIKDRFLRAGETLDHRSANEGFLFLLLLFTLVHSPRTPSFFAIDNVDTSLNPKLCTAVVRRLVALAGQNHKQVILTTHNPSVLDGLDLTDDEQRLFAVSRDSEGGTRVRRIPAPKPLGDDPPIRLSEAFVKGYLGGLPKNF